MRTTTWKLLGTMAALAAWLGGPGPAEVRGDEPPRAQQAAPPPSLILELETHEGAAYGRFSAMTITDFRAKPGDGLAGPGWRKSAAFTVVEIPDKDRVKVWVADNLGLQNVAGRDRDEKLMRLRSGETLRVNTNTCDAGTDYALRISDLDEVPVVKADDPKVVAAISAHANVTKDEVGSIQEIGPPGVVGRGDRVPRRTEFDPGKGPTDEDLKNIAKLNNLRRLFLNGSAITDAGAAHLKNLSRLTALDLSNTEIGDAGLEHLNGLANLRSLTLCSTNVSKEGVEKLRKALPNCKIDRQPATDDRTPVTGASPEAVLSELHRKFPGKSDDQIIETLRGYIPVDPTGGGKGKDWLAHRLQAARRQWQEVQAIEKDDGKVFYDYEIDKSYGLVHGAKPSAPRRCENCWETISSIRSWLPA